TDAFGAEPGGAALHRRVVRAARTAHVPRAQGVFPGPVPAERAAPGGVRRRSCGIARAATFGGGRGPRDFRPVSVELLPVVESESTRSPGRGDFFARLRPRLWPTVTTRANLARLAAVTTQLLEHNGAIAAGLGHPSSIRKAKSPSVAD